MTIDGYEIIVSNRSTLKDGAYELDADKKVLRIASIIYDKLKSIVNNSELTVPSTLSTSFSNFLLELENYSNGIGEPSEEIVLIDKFLGSLYDIEYNIIKDIPVAQPAVKARYILRRGA